MSTRVIDLADDWHWLVNVIIPRLLLLEHDDVVLLVGHDCSDIGEA